MQKVIVTLNNVNLMKCILHDFPVARRERRRLYHLTMKIIIFVSKFVARKWSIEILKSCFTSCVFLFFFWSSLSCSISPVLGKDLIVVSNLACLCFCCCRKHARSSGRSLRLDTVDISPPLPWPSIVLECSPLV